ncbi:MAG: hypothetical protein U0P45_11440 [Acidimicrobiales bacterium]
MAEPVAARPEAPARGTWRVRALAALGPAWRSDLVGPGVYLVIVALTSWVEVLALPGGVRDLHHRWAGWDSWRYLAIADTGYHHHTEVGWLPGYPVTIRVFLFVVHDHEFAGVVGSLVAGCLASYLLCRWTRVVGLSERERAAALLSVLLFPYAFFLYGIVYPVALYLALALGAYLLAERRRMVEAYLLVALATVVHPSALALLTGITAFALERDGVLGHRDGRHRWLRWTVVPTIDRSRFQRSHWWALLSLLGLGGWLAFCALALGSPFAYAQEQRRVAGAGAFSRKAMLSLDYMSRVLSPRHQVAELAQATIGLALVVAGLLLVPAIVRRLGWGYAALGAVTSLLVYVTSADFVSAPRYMASCFPVLVICGLAVARRSNRVAIPVALVAAGSMVGLHVLFAASIAYPAW